MQTLNWKFIIDWFELTDREYITDDILLNVQDNPIKKLFKDETLNLKDINKMEISADSIYTMLKIFCINLFDYDTSIKLFGGINKNGQSKHLSLVSLTNPKTVGYTKQLKPEGFFPFTNSYKIIFQCSLYYDSKNTSNIKLVDLLMSIIISEEFLGNHILVRYQNNNDLTKLVIVPETFKRNRRGIYEIQDRDLRVVPHQEFGIFNSDKMIFF